MVPPFPAITKIFRDSVFFNPSLQPKKKVRSNTYLRPQENTLFRSNPWHRLWLTLDNPEEPVLQSRFHFKCMWYVSLFSCKEGLAPHQQTLWVVSDKYLMNLEAASLLVYVEVPWPTKIKWTKRNHNFQEQNLTVKLQHYNSQKWVADILYRVPESGGRLVGWLVLSVVLYQPWAAVAQKLNRLQRWYNQCLLFVFSFCLFEWECKQLCPPL